MRVFSVLLCVVAASARMSAQENRRADRATKKSFTMKCRRMPGGCGGKMAMRLWRAMQKNDDRHGPPPPPPPSKGEERNILGNSNPVATLSTHLERPRVTMADSEPRGRRIAVLAVGLLRGLMDERARRKSSTFLRAVAPTHCFAVFEALPSEEGCTPDALRHARALLSADGARVAQVRLVETSELRQAACSCMACPANVTATKQPSGANACRGMYLQFHKVFLAFRMLEGAERDGARFDAVLRIRMDLGFLVLPVLEAQLQHAASTTTAVLLQRDAAWLASRRVATAVAVAWSIMGEQLGLLRSSAGSYPLFQALRRLDWSRLASSCWAFTSKFIPCLPFPADWPGGWSLARVREMATDASDLEATLSNRSRIWIAASQKCFWIRGRAPAHRLGFNPEPEVHLGLALFVVPSHGGGLAYTADHDNCTSFGSVPWSKGRTYGCTTKTIAKPAAGEPSSALIATTIALAATALSKPLPNPPHAAGHSSLRMRKMLSGYGTTSLKQMRCSSAGRAV